MTSWSDQAEGPAGGLSRQVQHWEAQLWLKYVDKASKAWCIFSPNSNPLLPALSRNFGDWTPTPSGKAAAARREWGGL